MPERPGKSIRLESDRPPQSSSLVEFNLVAPLKMKHICYSVASPTSSRLPKNEYI